MLDTVSDSWFCRIVCHWIKMHTMGIAYNSAKPRITNDVIDKTRRKVYKARVFYPFQAVMTYEE